MNGVARRNVPTWAYTRAEAARRGLDLCGFCGCASLPWTLHPVADRADLSPVCPDCAHWLAHDTTRMVKR